MAWRLVYAWIELGCDQSWQALRDKLGCASWPPDLGPDREFVAQTLRELERLVRPRVGDGVDWGEFHRGVLDLCESAPNMPVALAAGAGRQGPSPERRRLGSFYTPPAIVAELLDESLQPALERMFAGASNDPDRTLQTVLSLRILDPACGSGRILVGALGRLARVLSDSGVATTSDLLQRVAKACLFGVDVDGLAASVARVELQRATGAAPGTLFEDNIREADALLDMPWAPATFDLVLGNPPFVDSERLVGTQAAYRRRVCRAYSVAQGNWDLYVPFFELGLRALREGGSLAFVAPAKLLASQYCAQLHTLLLGQQLQRFRVYSDGIAFSGANAPFVMSVVRRTTPPPHHAVVFESRGSSKPARPTRKLVPQSELHGLPPGFWCLPWNARCKELVQIARAWRPLSDFGTFSDGSTTAQAYVLKDCLVDIAPGAEARERWFKVINTGTIDPGRVLWGERPLRYLGLCLLHPRIRARDLERLAPTRVPIPGQERIVLAGLARRLEAARVEPDFFCAKSTVVMRLLAGANATALLRWLNSDLAGELYVALFGLRSLSQGAFQVGPRQLAQLPCPPLRCAPASRTDAGIPNALKSMDSI